MDFTFLITILAFLFSLFVAGAMVGAIFSKPFRTKVAEVLHLTHPKLERPPQNPILKPGATPWTAEAVMNPAALEINDKTYLVYRAIGSDGVSRLGFALSNDGVHFDNRSAYPAFVARSPRAASWRDPLSRRYSPVMYPSGGSWGGCEDPRMVLIDDRIYVTFNMFDGWDFIRVAAISISKEDFVAEHFGKWEGPFILSPEGERHKNWVLFPEKIHGKFALLHSIFGETAESVRVEYTDDIESFAAIKGFESPDPLAEPNNQIAWHYRMRSAGPPPIKTDRGWLVLYHAMDPKEPSRYKMGAMLLDLDDPTKVLYRSQAPVLSPDATYENDGKPGIIYACGAVVHDGTLYVYYGGADKVTCVATAPLDTFIDALVHNEQPTLVR